MAYLDKYSTKPSGEVEEDDIRAKTEKIQARIVELKDKLYAQKQQSLLIIVQGMDSSGKDGVTEAVLGKCSPLGVHVTGYKKPTHDEFAHDFLWRIHPHTPAKGEIAVFVRSHYEDVLIQKVHKWITEDKCKNRYEAINAFEQNLQNDANTTVVKLFLHISKEKQLEKLEERITDPTKYWKHNDSDWDERELWDDYMKAYDAVFEKCNQPEWHVIAADKRWYRNYCAAKVVLEALEKIAPEYPPLISERFGKNKK